MQGKIDRFCVDKETHTTQDDQTDILAESRAAGMTRRSILLGLFGAAFVCGFTYFNDAVMRQTFFVGNHMPFSVYGGLVVFLLVGKPLLGRISRRLVLSSQELAVILTLTLASCCIPGSALLRIFTPTLILPHRFAKTDPAWENAKIVELAPSEMLADVSRNENVVLDGFVLGLGEGGKHISPTRVPWYAWIRTFAFWVPLIVTFWVALIALAVVVHPQWSRHDLLPYPIAAFARSLLEPDPHDGVSVFRKRAFWIGLIVIVLIHLINYLHVWFPDKVFQIKTWLDLAPLGKLFPNFSRGGGGGLLAWHNRIFPTAIAVAFFLPSDVSFSAGISPLLFFTLAGILAKYGISFVGGGYFQPNPSRFLNFGAFVGVFLVILYTGRYYYTQVISRAFGLSRTQQVEESSVWAMRIFLLAMAIFVVQLTVVGLDWHVAVLFCLGSVVFFLVMGRVIAETGIFFFQPQWFPCIILMGLFGPQALGLRNLLIVSLVTVLIVTDGRETLMSYMVNSLKLVESVRLQVGKVAPFGVVALLVGLGVGLPLVLYLQYDLGANMTDGWGCNAAPRFAFEETVRIRQRLVAQDTLEASDALTGLGRLAEIKPDNTLLGVGLLGCALAVGFAFCRIRFAKWPLHPVVLLIGTSWAGCQFCYSLLIGWFLKLVIVKYGGVQYYRRVQILMFGVIAGDMLGGFLPMAIGTVYYLITQKSPPPFRIFPG